jgi:hypothetical protein
LNSNNASQDAINKSQRYALNPKEFAGLFGKSATWTYRQLYAGKIVCIEGCGTVMIPQTEADRLCNEAKRYEGRRSLK